MPKFKVGDKVKSDFYSSTPEGNIFTVVDVKEGYLRCTCDAGNKEVPSDFIWTIPACKCELVETAKETYEVGKWYGWNGGECPVDEDTLVEVIFGDGSGAGEHERAGTWMWNVKHYPVAFRIVPQEVEKAHVFVGWIDGVFHHSYTFFKGATHKIFEGMTIAEI